MFDIDLQSRIPIYEQLYRRVVELVMSKQLSDGDKLPSVRELAKNLGVNPNTVSKALQMLERDGIIYSLPGKGSFVSEKNTHVIQKNAETDFSGAVRAAVNAGLDRQRMTEIIDTIITENQERGNKK